MVPSRFKGSLRARRTLKVYLSQLELNEFLRQFLHTIGTKGQL